MSDLARLPERELRQLAAGAEALLRLEAAQLYGLVDGGPEINQDRCLECLEVAREAGIELTEDEIDTAIAATVLQFAGAGDG